MLMKAEKLKMQWLPLALVVELFKVTYWLVSLLAVIAIAVDEKRRAYVHMF